MAVWMAAMGCMLPFFASSAYAEENLGKAKYNMASQAFEVVNRKYDEASSLQYQVERKTVAKGITVVEKWDFACATPGILKIDYRAPEKRVFMADGQTFTEYLPAARMAQRTSMSGKDAPAAREQIASVLQRLSVDGLRIGDYGELLNHLATVEVSSNKPAILIAEGENPRYRIRIDTQRKLLLSFEKWNRNGDLEQSIQAGGFVEPKPGFWMPAKVKTVFLDRNELAERETTISGVKVDSPFSAKTLDFTLPDDVEIKK